MISYGRFSRPRTPLIWPTWQRRGSRFNQWAEAVLPEPFLVDFLKDDKGHLEVEKVGLH